MSMITGRVPTPMQARLALSCRPLRLPLRCVSRPGPTYPGVLKGPCRSYATAPRCENPYAYTWLTKTPDEIIPEDVLAGLPPVPASLLKSGNIPILLATPSFAPWIDPASPFLEEYVNRLLEHVPDIRSLGSFYAVAAIVDKLPDIRGQSGNENSRNDSQESSDSDGLSLLFVRAEDVQGKAAAPRRIRSSGAEEPALVFSVDVTSSGGTRAAAQGPVHEVGLRLANTVFVNGNEKTLFGMRWTLDTDLNRFRLDRSIDLSDCVIKSTAESVYNDFDFPLYPVGQRRRVISGMGNILRQLAKSSDENDQSNTPIPASLELEKEIPRYIEEHDVDDPLVSVWALVETPDIAVSTETEDLQTRLSHSLRAGGKLHHVMSGGGGWGKKQGLLSLDPEVSFSDAVARKDFQALDQLFEPREDFMSGLPPFLTQEVTGDDLSDLDQTAKPGDYVQFFVSVKPNADQNAQLNKSTSHGKVAYQFGVVAHSDTPEVQAIDADGHQKDLVAIPNYFGALSEKAIAYLQPVTNTQANGQQQETGTKLDVPGCRVKLSLV